MSNSEFCLRNTGTKLLLCTLFGLVIASVFACPGASAAPKIRAERAIHNFGQVEEGIEVSSNFIIHNDGDKPLRIYAAISTCGCTIASLRRKTISAGAMEKLKVVMDTSMKQGPVTKEITVKSNDPKRPVLRLFVIADVRDPHTKLGGNVQAKIFQGRCAECHSVRGNGKFGEELFVADCAMCHGLMGDGAVGPNLVRLDYEANGMAEEVRKIIANGSPNHRSMPGFSKRLGGPLNDLQIASIIKHLKDLSLLDKRTVR